MSYNIENFSRIRREFDEKARKARETADARSEILRTNFPAIREIDSILASTGLRIMDAVSLGKEGLNGRLASLKEENKILLDRRAKLLVQNGYSSDWDSPHYSCPICSDTGFINGKMCACLKKELLEAAIKDSGLGKLIEKQNFENFSTQYYKDQAQAENILSICRAFAENFGSGEPSNLLLTGGTGLGKTHLSTSVASVVLSRGFYVIYEPAQDLLSAFERARFGSDRGAAGVTEKYFDCDLLIIDDLGCEIANQFTVSVLYDVLNTRINSGKPMMINTNLVSDELRRRYGDRIASRLLGEFEPLKLTGTDIRMQKKVR